MAVYIRSHTQNSSVGARGQTPLPTRGQPDSSFNTDRRDRIASAMKFIHIYMCHIVWLFWASCIHRYFESMDMSWRQKWKPCPLLWSRTLSFTHGPVGRQMSTFRKSLHAYVSFYANHLENKTHENDSSLD